MGFPTFGLLLYLAEGTPRPKLQTRKRHLLTHLRGAAVVAFTPLRLQWGTLQREGLLPNGRGHAGDFKHPRNRAEGVRV